MSCADIIVCGLNILTLVVAAITLFSTKKQFDKNMREQERAINVSLFDLRTEILTAVQNDNFSFNRTRADLLFDTEISNMIFELDYLRDKANTLERKLENYHRGTVLIEEYGEEKTERFLSDLAEYESTNPDDPRYDELERKIVKVRPIEHNKINEEEYEEVEWPSFVEIRDTLDETDDKIYNLTIEIADKMEKFIEDSISTGQKNKEPTL